jgi:hypothetical protein
VAWPLQLKDGGIVYVSAKEIIGGVTVLTTDETADDPSVDYVPSGNGTCELLDPTYHMNNPGYSSNPDLPVGKASFPPETDLAPPTGP